MMRHVRLALISAAVGAMATSGTFANPAAKKQPDPNEVVCEKQKELGSRLSMKRVCMTRAEWAQRRLLDRQEVDKAQTNKGIRGDY